MLRGVDNEELSGVNSRIWHAYGTATPIERLYSILRLPQSATEPIVCHALHTIHSIALQL